jgi:hypothetical protein
MEIIDSLNKILTDTRKALELQYKAQQAYAKVVKELRLAQLRVETLEEEVETLKEVIKELQGV